MYVGHSFLAARCVYVYAVTIIHHRRDRMEKRRVKQIRVTAARAERKRERLAGHKFRPDLLRSHLSHASMEQCSRVPDHQDLDALRTYEPLPGGLQRPLASPRPKHSRAHLHVSRTRPMRRPAQAHSPSMPCLARAPRTSRDRRTSTFPRVDWVGQGA